LDGALEHGIALHSQSVVFDGYAFAPQAAVDGAALAKAMEEGASDIELQDLTENMTMTRCVSDPAEREEFELASRSRTCPSTARTASPSSSSP
jgi:membrane dipeptidase